MKYLRTLRVAVVLSFAVLLSSCGKHESTETPAEEKEFDLSEIPNDWVMLTPKDGSYIIYNSCDAGNLLITIDNAAATLLLHGTQEDEEFEILKSYTGKNDTIVIKAKWKGADRFLDFKFIWEDKAKNVGRWITKYDEHYSYNFVFVPANLQSQFTTVEQPCRECWGDECDERDEQEADSLNEGTPNYE